MASGFLTSSCDEPLAPSQSHSRRKCLWSAVSSLFQPHNKSVFTKNTKPVMDSSTPLGFHAATNRLFFLNRPSHWSSASRTGPATQHQPGAWVAGSGVLLLLNLQLRHSHLLKMDTVPGPRSLTPPKRAIVHTGWPLHTTLGDIPKPSSSFPLLRIRLP